MSEYTSREELIEELLASGETRTEYGWDKAIDAVLEIIEGHIESRFYPDGSVDYVIEDVEGLIDAIEVLKGGEH